MENIQRRDEGRGERHNAGTSKSLHSRRRKRNKSESAREQRNKGRKRREGTDAVNVCKCEIDHNKPLAIFCTAATGAETFAAASGAGVTLFSSVFLTLKELKRKKRKGWRERDKKEVRREETR